jgi:hypothetical protein
VSRAAFRAAAKSAEKAEKYSEFSEVSALAPSLLADFSEALTDFERVATLAKLPAPLPERAKLEAKLREKLLSQALLQPLSQAAKEDSSAWIEGWRSVEGRHDLPEVWPARWR